MGPAPAGSRRLSLANRIVRRTLEIIHYLRPCRWFMENPRTGLLKAQPFMDKHQFVDADYCQFADWGYQKPTRVWFGTCGNPRHRKQALINQVCPGCKECPNMVGNRHRVHLSSHGPFLRAERPGHGRLAARPKSKVPRAVSVDQLPRPAPAHPGRLMAAPKHLPGDGVHTEATQPASSPRRLEGGRPIACQNVHDLFVR